MTTTSIQNNFLNTTQTAITLDNGKNENFSALLASKISESMTTVAHGSDVVNGRIGVDYRSDKYPSRVSYFDEKGVLLTSSAFDAEEILRNTQKYGINISDLSGIGQQLDKLGVGYKPYELYPGTGSDHGINFEDLISGGMGTAYDWTKDSNAALKDSYLVGTGAAGQASNFVKESQAFATKLSIVKHSDITTEHGIDPTKFSPVKNNNGNALNYVVYTGGTASWYETQQAALLNKPQDIGQIIDVSNSPSSLTQLNSTGDQILINKNLLTELLATLLKNGGQNGGQTRMALT